MKRFTLTIIAIIFTVIGTINAQTTGDYKSVGNVTLSASTNWQTWNGTQWVAASRAPQSGDGTITISTGNTLSTDWGQYFSISKLIINGSIDLKNNATLTILSSGTSNDLTVNNNISIDGSLNLSSGTKVVFNKDVTMTNQSGAGFSLAGVQLVNYGNFSFAYRPVTFDANSKITNQNGATFDMSGLNPTFLGTFDNYGTLKVQGSFTVNQNSVLTNYPNSQFIFSNDGGNVNINGTFNNSTAINYLSKTITISTSGIYNNLNGATITLGWGTVTIEGLLYNTGNITYPDNYNRISFGMNGVYEHAQNGGNIPLINNCATTGTVRISGVTTTAPTFPASQTTYYNLEWKCASQTSAAPLPTTITVNNKLILNGGYITVGNNNQLILSANAGVTVSNSTSFVNTPGNGVMRKYFSSNTPFVYPLGSTLGGFTDNSVTVTFTSGSYNGGYVDAKLTSSKHPNNSSGTNYLNCYWTLTSGNMQSFSANASFKFSPANLVGDATGMFLLRYNGTSWATFEHPSNNVLSITRLTSFGDFTGGLEGALPVELESFTSAVTGRDVNLKWATSKEINNSGFEVERSVAGKNEWTSLAFVKGNGNTNTLTQYSYSDVKLETGSYQYRLKQIDYNGNYEYHNLNGDITISVPTKFDLTQNYPNPFNPTTKIDFSIPSNGAVKLAVYDMSGKEVKVLVNDTRNAGYYTVQFDASGLSSGTYFYRITTGSYSAVKKMVLIK